MLLILQKLTTLVRMPMESLIRIAMSIFLSSWRPTFPATNDRLRLTGLFKVLVIPKDILVYTPAEIDDWKDVPESFVTQVIKKVVVVYDKNSEGI